MVLSAPARNIFYILKYYTHKSFCIQARLKRQSVPTSLGVVVVHEDEGLVRLGHAPAVVDHVAQLVEVLDAPGDLHRIAELGGTA